MNRQDKKLIVNYPRDREVVPMDNLNYTRKMNADLKGVDETVFSSF